MLKHKLIQWQTPFLLKCANKVDPFSKALFLGGFCNEFTSFTGTEPCSCGNHRAEYTRCLIRPSASGLNWHLGWGANDWPAMQKKKKKTKKKKPQKKQKTQRKKKKKEKKGKKKREGLLLQCKVRHNLKCSVWEWEQLAQGMPVLQRSFPAPSWRGAAASTRGANTAAKELPAHTANLPRQQQPRATGLRTETLSWSYPQG